MTSLGTDPISPPHPRALTLIASGGEASSGGNMLRYTLGVAGGSRIVLVPQLPISSSPGTRPLLPKDLEFWFEQKYFDSIPKSELVRFEGLHVASRHGRIIDSDSSLEALTNRFFTTYGDVPVYIAKVGDEEPERIDTPFEV